MNLLNLLITLIDSKIQNVKINLPSNILRRTKSLTIEPEAHNKRTSFPEKSCTRYFGQEPIQK